MIFTGCGLVSDIAIFVLKRDVKLQLTNYLAGCGQRRKHEVSG